MKRTLKDYLLISAKGIAMGAADVVPGVSGGTIAFITGIYEELLSTISSVNLDSLKVLKNEGLKGFWNHINGNFLVALLLGVGVSIASLAKLITYLLKNHDILLWSFFFGLIISSIYLVGKTIKKWDAKKIVTLIIGAAIAFYITILPPMENPGALWFVFLSGAIAICAMILPGISGSFILLLLGSYELVLSAIKDIKLTIIAVFGIGCVVGLLSFSKLLNWMFKKYHDLTIALLTGFLVGSLNKIWPWKITTSFRTNSHGEEVPFLQDNILPTNYNGDSQLLLAILMAIIGLVLIVAMEKFAAKKK
jgi:putative membrane protein